LVAEPDIILHPGAEEDYVEAFAWYFERATTVAYDFEHEVERALRLAAQNPLRWPKFDDVRRRIILRKFPYSIIYEIMDSRIVILAVAHGRRKPFYWRERVR
jgi:plasmid stabilization system protein ParE